MMVPATLRGSMILSMYACFPAFSCVLHEMVFELTRMMQWALKQKSTVAIRYPREAVPTDIPHDSYTSISAGKGETLIKGKKDLFVGIGCYGGACFGCCPYLCCRWYKSDGCECTIYKPIDSQFLKRLCSRHEHSHYSRRWSLFPGGFGSAVLEEIEQSSIGAVVSYIVWVFLTGLSNMRSVASSWKSVV